MTEQTNAMIGRELLKTAAKLGLVAVIALSVVGDLSAGSAPAEAPVSTAEHPLCPVCGMDVDPATAPKSVFKGKTYYFCSDDDKKIFDAAPDKFADAGKKL
jgi:YHS domain-containing protein